MNRVNGPIRVAVVDDSRLMRSLLKEILETDPGIKVVAVAGDPYEAREKIKQCNPDVITLDIEMPKMDGISFLRNLMRLRPMPVIMVSTLTQHGAEITLEALSIGAVDYLPKPRADDVSEFMGYADQLKAKIRMAVGANLDAVQPESVLPPDSKRSAGPWAPAACRLIAIGASTGGTEAIRQVLERLPADVPPIVITQHISAPFSRSFAKRLNQNSRLHVQEVDCDTRLQPGHAYLAPGDRHLTIRYRGEQLKAVLSDASPVNRHRPSVDVLFSSIAECGVSPVLGILLTGMGADGAQGLLQLYAKAEETWVQDEQSSVVWGMPRSAVQLGAAKQIYPLGRIAKEIQAFCARPVPQSSVSHRRRSKISTGELQ